MAFVPHDALAVILVPSIRGTIRRSDTLMKKLRTGVLSAIASKPLELIKQELGFDPEQPETMKAKGIDPDSGMAFALGHGSEALLVMSFVDQGALDKYLREQLNKMLRGGATFTSKKVSSVKVTLVGEQGRPPVGAWTFVKKHLIVGACKDGDPGELVARLTKLDKTIKDNAVFSNVTETVGEHDLLLYVDGASAQQAVTQQTKQALENASDSMKRVIAERQQTSDAALSYFRGAALALRVQEDRLALRSFFAPPVAKAKVLREVFGGNGESPEFGKYIAPDALLVGRASLDVKKLIDKLLEILPPHRKRRIYRQMERMERENNFSLEKDLLSLLSGRYAGALFAPKPGALRAPPRSLGELNSVLPVVLMAQVNNSKKVGELLTRLERFMVLQGLDVRARTEGDRRTYTLETEGRPVGAWTLVNNVLVVASGGRLASTVKMIEHGDGENVLDQLQSKQARKILEANDGIMLNANVLKIADALRGLDLGMEVKLMLMPIFNAIAKFKDVTLFFEVESDGLFGELAVTLN